eukprot:8030748-Alexandrium_andersonii.AAC.1
MPPSLVTTAVPGGSRLTTATTTISPPAGRQQTPRPSWTSRGSRRACASVGGCGGRCTQWV